MEDFLIKIEILKTKEERKVDIKVERMLLILEMNLISNLL